MGGVHVEIEFGGEPLVALLAEEGGDELKFPRKSLGKCH